MTLRSPEAAPGTLFVETVRRAAEAGLSVTRIAPSRGVATKFGIVEAAALTLAGTGERGCQAFRLGDPESGLRIHGWSCGTGGDALDDRRLACFIDGIGLAAQTDQGQADQRRSGSLPGSLLRGRRGPQAPGLRPGLPHRRRRASGAWIRVRPRGRGSSLSSTAVSTVKRTTVTGSAAYPIVIPTRCTALQPYPSGFQFRAREAGAGPPHRSRAPGSRRIRPTAGRARRPARPVVAVAQRLERIASATRSCRRRRTARPRRPRDRPAQAAPARQSPACPPGYARHPSAGRHDAAHRHRLEDAERDALAGRPGAMGRSAPGRTFRSCRARHAPGRGSRCG